jgi:hypothetical protein
MHAVKTKVNNLFFLPQIWLTRSPTIICPITPVVQLKLQNRNIRQQQIFRGRVLGTGIEAHTRKIQPYLHSSEDSVVTVLPYIDLSVTYLWQMMLYLLKADTCTIELCCVSYQENNSSPYREINICTVFDSFCKNGQTMIYKTLHKKLFKNENKKIFINRERIFTFQHW